MAMLNTIFVVHTTKNVPNAGTNADFALEIERVTGVDGRGRPVVNRIPLPFPDLPHDERERGRTDSYRFPVSRHRIGSDRSFEIYMHMLNTEDGWLPESIFVIGIGPGFGHVVLGSHQSWSGWFDRNDRNSLSRHLIGGWNP